MTRTPRPARALPPRPEPSTHKAHKLWPCPAPSGAEGRPRQRPHWRTKRKGGGAEARRPVSAAERRGAGCPPPILPSILTAGGGGPGCRYLGWHTPCFCWVTWDRDSLLRGLGEDHSPRGRESASRGGSPPSAGGWLAQSIRFLRPCPTPLTHPGSLTQAGSQHASEEWRNAGAWWGGTPPNPPSPPGKEAIMQAAPGTKQAWTSEPMNE